MKHWPDVYSFGTPIGPVFKWFAWYPVRTWWGKWVWMETVMVSRIIKEAHLDGADWVFWSYERIGPI